MRRKSNYPTLLALHNALVRLQETGTEAAALGEYLLEQLTEIHEHAKRERAFHH